MWYRCVTMVFLAYIYVGSTSLVIWVCLFLLGRLGAWFIRCRWCGGGCYRMLKGLGVFSNIGVGVHGSMSEEVLVCQSVK